MVQSRRSTRTAFTLVELMAVLVLTAGIAAVTAPIVLSASGAFTDASTRRDRTEAASMALDRIVRTLREAPDRGESGPGVPAIASLSAMSIGLEDGAVVALNGQTLELTVPGSDPAPLCTGVDAFELTYFGSDGTVIDPAAAGAADEVRVVEIRLACAAAVELRTRVLLRCTLGGG